MERNKSSGRGRILLKVSRAFAVLLLSFFILSCLAAALVPAIVFRRSDAIPPTERVYGAQDAAAYPRRAVEFPSGGAALRGWLYGGGDDAALIIVVGGFGSGADTHLPEIEYFVDAGFAVLCYDGTGVRSSGGRGTRGLAQARLDLEAVLGFAEADPELSKLPILLYGHSAGGWAAASALDEHPEIAGAVCISAFDSPDGLMLSRSRDYVGVLADIEYPMLRLWSALRFGRLGEESASEAALSSGVPLFAAQGADDIGVPLADSLYSRLAASPGCRAELLLVMGGSRSEHSSLWLTEEAAELRADILAGEESDGGDPWELDGDFMERIVGFYSLAVEAYRDKIA